MDEFWRTIVANSSALAAIILIIVGIFKLPLMKLKSKKWYRPLLTFITLAVFGGTVVIAQLYVFNSTLSSFGFYALAGTTLLGVYLSYNTVYEGTRLKDLVHSLFAKVVKLLQSTPEAKVHKVVKKYGLESVAKIVSEIATPEPAAPTETVQDKQ